MEAQAITIRGLVKEFSRFKLGPIDLNVPSGAIYGLIGSNGAGKTTTIDCGMRALMTDHAPKKGKAPHWEARRECSYEHGPTTRVLL